MYDTRNQKFKDAKYGLFVHFGLYSILAGAYKGKITYGLSEWIQNSLGIPKDEYAKLKDEFNPYLFDAESLVLQAKKWGMQYIVFTAKHHDGFAMWNSFDDFNITNTPYGKDLLAELSSACEKYDMPLGLYYSQAQDWHDPNAFSHHHDFKGDFDKYFYGKCLKQVEELLTNYGSIFLMWYDTPLAMPYERCQELYDLTKALQKDCLISGRIGHDLGDYMTTTDNCIPRLTFAGDFEVSGTLNDTWGYSDYDKNYKSAATIKDILLKINNRGGNYLLNIGPKADGSIPKMSCKILNEVGKYVTVNRESIFATKGLPYYPYDLDWAQMTCKDHDLYLHIIRPKRSIDIQNIANEIEKIYVVEDGRNIDYIRCKSCEGYSEIAFDLPEDLHNRSDYCLCLKFKEKEPLFEMIRSE